MVAFSYTAVPRLRARKSARASIIENVKGAVLVSFRYVKPDKKTPAASSPRAFERLAPEG
jgi:hypothetical protein